ncbi:MAG: tol-pal system protein YbgF [Gammaproteobacteria bacterium]|nr:tol-pal system protein YbgF [Gammaproteobacteria bacterium]NNJ73248.1 tol-pal system protein YbgF [Enterobacterales bacterium]
MRPSIIAPKMIKPWALCLWLISLGLPSTVLLAQAEVKRSVSVSMEDKLDRLEKQLATANRMRAEFQFQITNLQNEIRNMSGIIEEQSYQIEQLTKRQRDLFRDIDAIKLGDVGTNKSPATNQNSTIPRNTVQTPVTPDTGISATPTTPTNVSEEDIRNEYDSIFPLVRNKQFDEAVARYESFIASYPNSSYISNARYWLAQIYSVQGKEVEAEREYQIVAQQFPQSSKAADAYLKLGQLYESQRDSDRAFEMYQKILNDYASTNAARFAQQRLDNLNRN